MGKIGDLWVRLGLKSDDYKKGMDRAKKETTSFGASLGKMKAGALAVWAAIGAAVIAFAKDFINHSQTMGDMWNQVTGKMKTAWSQFLTALTTWDWEGFGQRVRKAMDATSKSISAHDAEFEVQNSIKLRKSAMDQELASLQIIMRDTRKSYAERAKAAQDYIDKVRPLYLEEQKLRRDIMVADANEYLVGAKVGASASNRDILRTYLTDIAKNSGYVTALREGNDESAIAELVGKYGKNRVNVMERLAKYYEGTNDDDANKVVDAFVGYDRSLAALEEELRRIFNVKNSALAQYENELASAAAAQSEKEQNFAAAIKKAADQIEETTETDLAAAIEEAEDAIDNMELVVPPIDTSALDEGLKEIQEQAARYQAQLDYTEDMASRFGDAVASSLSGGMEALTDMMFSLEGADASSVLSAFMTPFANMAKQMGEMFIAEGVTIEVAKKTSLNPLSGGLGLIAAGAALAAIGAAMTSGLKAIAQGGGASGSSASYGGSSYGSSTAQNYESTLTVYVEGRISGNDIVISGNKTQNSLGR